MSNPQIPNKPDMIEVATTGDGRDITRGWVSPDYLLPPEDQILAQRGGNLTIYKEVFRDEQVKACFAQRQLAVVSKEWQVTPASQKRQDKMAADFLAEQLKAVNFDRATEKMLYGVFYGYSIAECMWGRDGANVTLDEIKVRDRRRFKFDGLYRPRLLTMENPMPGELLPDAKFWHFRTGSDHDDEPYGLGLAHWLYWPTQFKRQGMKFWLIFLEKFGQPTAKGTYPTNATAEERNRLLQALRAIQTDSGVIVPEGMVIELIEAARSGTVDYTSLYDRMDAAIAKAVLGQTASTQGTPGKLGNDSLQQDVRLDIIKADADLVCESFNRSVVQWLTAWNFPTAKPPRVYRRVEEPDDTNQISARDQRIYSLGYKPTLKYIIDTYGGEWEPAPSPKPPVDPSLPSPPRGPSFAEAPMAVQSEPPAPAQLIADNLAKTAQPAMGDWISQIEAMLESASSLDEFKGMLLAAFDELDTGKFGKAMAAAMAVADAAGRFDVEKTSA
ncbi:MAG: DUF935 domain-containing protein [Halothiobacillus sp.]